MEELAPKLLVIAINAVVAFVLDRMLIGALRRVVRATSLPSASIFVNIVRVIIWSFAILGILQPVFGIEPTAVVAALGVGSVALSLGLQSTISNIIGGLTITAGKVVEPGDWVSVAGVTGQVTDITWRHTVVRDILGSETIVPNEQMMSSEVCRLSDLAAHKTNFTVEVVPGADLDAVVAEAQHIVRTYLSANGYAWSQQQSLCLMDGMSSFGPLMNVVLFIDDPTKAGLARDCATRALGSCSWIAGLPEQGGAGADTAKETETIRQA